MIALLAALVLGTDGGTVDGVVTELVEHGAFVQFGANEVGFLHVDRMSWSGEKDPAKLVKQGQKVKVRVEPQTDPKRPSLVLRRDEDDPWLRAPAKYRVGTTHRAKVIHLPESGNGVFFELEPWVRVLVHKSDLPDAQAPSNYTLGQVVMLKVMSVDVVRKRIAGSLR